MKTHYVNCILISDDRSEICVIFKQRGPIEVLNKFNFIGGKVENETSEQAVVREVMEETGLDLSNEKISLLNIYENDFYRLDNHVVFISKSKLHQAKTCESEKISILNIKNLQLELKELPNKYSPSFKTLLDEALSIS